MGGFYGSVQVRSDDRDKVVRAAAAAAVLAGIRCLIGPELDGWVGVYPEGAGQDENVGQNIAKDMGGEVLQLIVHDDAVMIYMFWLDGQLVDSYWSNPGFFNEADRETQLQMSGDPVAFGDLLINHVDVMLAVLKREGHEFTFEASRLQRFADLLGIHNAVTSYEYLKAGERVAVEGWENFEEVPAEAVAAELAAIRQRRQLIVKRKEQLKHDHLLLSDVVEDQLLPKACTAGGGLLVAWEGFGRGEARIDFYRPPWGEPEPGEIETGGQVNAMAADGAGRRVAMALGNRVVVWEADGWQPILELVESDWAVQAALGADGNLVAYASREGVYVHEVDSGKRVTALSSHDAPALAFHPSGEWLLTAGTAVWVARIHAKDAWRELYPGGQTPLPPELSQAVQKEMTRVNLDAMEQKWRTAIEASVQKMAAAGQNSAATAQLVEKMRQQMDKQLQQMRENFANLKAGKLPPPRHGNERVFCAGFTGDGSRLWLGTDQGVRVYDWEVVEHAGDHTAMPAPVISHNPDPAKVPGSSHGLIYAATGVRGRPSLLFGGYTGKVCHLDLNTGNVRELACPPDGGAIVGLTLAPDSSALGVCSRPALGETNDKQDERAVWEIWSYPALLAGPKPVRILSPEIVIESEG